jgi:hypothetical protein
MKIIDYVMATDIGFSKNLFWTNILHRLEVCTPKHKWIKTSKELPRHV